MARPLPSSRDLLAIHIHTCFTLDLRGRLVATNEPRAREAPRVFVARGAGEALIRTRSDIGEAVSRRWLACEDDETLRLRVAEHAPIAGEHRGPAFVIPPVTPSEDAVVVGPGIDLHPELIVRGWSLADTPPYVGIVRDGLVVAVCYSSRLGDEAAEAGVETAASYRGHGLAVEAVRAWAAAVQAGGRLALYSTESTNEASRRVAAKLGAIHYGEDWHLA